MLLRFGVANHRSLRDRQEISLVASSLGGNAEGLIACGHAPSGKLLPAVVVYGANASGKSNLIDAMRAMWSMVLYSHNRGEPSGAVSRHPFALDVDSKDAPSRFDVDFVINDVRYHYGFEATDKAFVSEWLFAFPNEKRRTLFERTGDLFRFSRYLKGRNQLISKITRPNSLFLSAAAQNGHEELTRIYKYFRDMVLGEAPISHLPAILAEKDIDDRIIGFLGKAGTGVVGYDIQNGEMHRNTLDFRGEKVNYLRLIVEEKESQVLKMALKPVVELRLSHQSATGAPVYFDLSQESEGTRRLLTLLAPVFLALDTGGVMVVDELDASLHTHACELLLALFSSPVTNSKGAQLIATTHDTNLLASRHLRRDQVWLTEKDAEGATHLYPLTDFRTRGNDNLARGYLQGRYGAVPFSGNLPDALAES